MRTHRLIPILLFLLPAWRAEAQLMSRPVSLSYRQEALGVVLSDISRQAQVRFSYSPYYVSVDQRVSVSVVNVPLQTALDTLFRPTAIGYAYIGGQIVLKTDPERLAQLEAMRREEATRRMAEERMLAERSRLRSQLPGLSRGQALELSGGDRYRELDLEKYRLAIAQVDEAETPPTPPPPSNHSVAQVSVLPFLGTNTYRSAEITNNLSFNVFWGANGGVDGVEVGGFVNTIINDVHGVQIAGLGNTVGGNLSGTQFGGLFNVVGGRTEGVQLAGLFNHTRHTDAVQVAGFFNIAGQDAGGAQVALGFNVGSGKAGVQVAPLFNVSGDTTRTQVSGLFNAAGHLKGAQVSALFNKARQVDGFQFGLINVADSVSGASLGLLNFVKKGYNRLEVGGGEALWGNVGLKLGTRGFYNILHVGARWDHLLRTNNERVQNGVYMTWGLGYGLGTAVRFNDRWLMNIEAVAIHLNEAERWTRQLNLLNQLRLTVDWRSAGRVSFFAGPVGNLLVSKRRDAETGLHQSIVAPYAWYDHTSGATNVKMWLGVYGGVRF